MSRYRRVEVGTWQDSRFRELSDPQPNAKSLWLYLLCGPRTTIFPGLVVATEAVIADDLRWPLHGGELFHSAGTSCFRDAWKEISSKGMAIADWRAGVVRLPRGLTDRAGVPRETARPSSPNAFRGWAKSWSSVPECRLTDDYLLDLETFAIALDRADKSQKSSYLNAYRDAFEIELGRLRERFESGREPTRVPDPSPVPDPVLSEVEPGSDAAPSGAPDTTGRTDRIPQPKALTRGGARAAGFVVPTSPGAVARAACDVPRDRRLAAVVPGPDLTARQALIERFIDRVNVARQDIALRHSLAGVRPIPLHGGEAESVLRERILEAGSDAERQLEHVLDVAIAEADAKKTVQWLGWTIGRNWVTLCQRTPADARRSANGTKTPVTCVPPRFDPLPAPPPMTEEERAEMAEMRARIVKDPIAAVAALEERK